MQTVLVLDIGGSFIKFGLMTNEKLGTVDKKKTPQTLEAFKICLKAIMEEFSESISGVSISMPGIINADTGYVIHGGSLKFINHMNILEFYQSIFSCPVAVENDARSAILGELHQGQLRQISNAAMIVLGTGVGGSLIINGEIVRGAHQAAGELSFVQTNESMLATNLFGVKNSVYSLLKPFAAAYGKKTNDVSGELFFNAVVSGNLAAQAILQEYCDSLAIQIWNLQTILDLEKIVLGGGISSQLILLDYVKQSIERNQNQLNLGPFSETISPNVVLSTLGNNANLVGAYFNFIQRHA